jgi:hypothetical protein
MLVFPKKKDKKFIWTLTQVFAAHYSEYLFVMNPLFDNNLSELSVKAQSAMYPSEQLHLD